MDNTFKLTEVGGVADYLKRINAEASGLLSARIEERVGSYRKRTVTIRFDPTNRGKVSLSPEQPEDSDLRPSEEERLALAQGFSDCPPIPESRTLPRLPERLPKRLELAQAEDRLFIHHSRQGGILMLTERVEEAEEGKHYCPWTFWNDGRWRMAELGGPMPLYGLEEMDRFGIVWLHEGQKAARAIQRLRDGNPQALAAHPWGKDLQHVGHLGWCSGAPNPGRTDWGPLQDAERVIVITDNDRLGIAAVPAIARHLNGTVLQIQFPKSFPVSFDMADPWPEGDQTRWRECLHPATWASRTLPAQKGRGAATGGGPASLCRSIRICGD